MTYDKKDDNFIIFKIIYIDNLLAIMIVYWRYANV